jgi:hypothetical protein
VPQIRRTISPAEVASINHVRLRLRVSPNQHRVLNPRDPLITASHVRCHHFVYLYRWAHSWVIRTTCFQAQSPEPHPSFVEVYPKSALSPGSSVGSRPNATCPSALTLQHDPRIMAHPSASGGTSLAPTPTHPHHLSRETSRDELEMAESLRRLNQAHDHQASRTATPSHARQPVPLPAEASPEIYHSLEDARPIQEGPATAATSVSSPLPPNSTAGVINAPISGQICR